MFHVHKLPFALLIFSLKKLDSLTRPTPKLPFDGLLASLLHNFSNLIYKYHEHDSLLEQNTEQDLSEEEKADAWTAYENDVKLRNQISTFGSYPNTNFQMPAGYDSLSSYNSTLYNSLYNQSTGSYGATSSMMNPLFSSMTAPQSSAYASDFRRLFENFTSPYYNMFNTGGTPSVSSSTTKNLYNSPNSNLLPSTTSATASMSSTTSPYLYSSINSRNVLPSTSPTPNYPNNLFPTMPSSSSVARSSYTNSFLSNPTALQMYMSSFGCDPLSLMSKSTSSVSSASAYDTSLAYLQQFSLLNSTNANSTSISSSSTAASASNDGSSHSNPTSHSNSSSGASRGRPPNASKELSLSVMSPPRSENQASVITKSIAGACSTKTTASATFTTQTLSASSTNSSIVTASASKTSTVVSASSVLRKSTALADTSNISIKGIDAINKSLQAKTTNIMPVTTTSRNATSSGDKSINSNLTISTAKQQTTATPTKTERNKNIIARSPHISMPTEKRTIPVPQRAMATTSSSNALVRNTNTNFGINDLSKQRNSPVSRGNKEIFFPISTTKPNDSSPNRAVPMNVVVQVPSASNKSVNRGEK